jgi:hypothetical protein
MKIYQSVQKLIVGVTDWWLFWNDQGHLYCHYHNTKFHVNPPIGSKDAPISEV